MKGDYLMASEPGAGAAASAAWAGGWSRNHAPRHWLKLSPHAAKQGNPPVPLAAPHDAAFPSNHKPTQQENKWQLQYYPRISRR